MITKDVTCQTCLDCGKSVIVAETSPGKIILFDKSTSVYRVENNPVMDTGMMATRYRGYFIPHEAICSKRK